MRSVFGSCRDEGFLGAAQRPSGVRILTAAPTVSPTPLNSLSRTETSAAGLLGPSSSEKPSPPYDIGGELHPLRPLRPPRGVFSTPGNQLNISVHAPSDFRPLSPDSTASRADDGAPRAGLASAWTEGGSANVAACSGVPGVVAETAAHCDGEAACLGLR